MPGPLAVLALAALLAADPAAAPSPSADLRRGEELVALGRGREAQTPLVRAALALPAERARALAALGRAQALAGEPFEAFRSLALAERLAAEGSPAAAAAHADATLLARFHLIGGGTAWGGFRPDPDLRYDLAPLRLGATTLAAARGTVWVGGKGGARDLAAGGGALPLPPGARVVALAAAPGGLPRLLLADGRVIDTTGRELAVAPASARRPTGLAAGPAGELAFLAGGQVERLSPDGSPLSALPELEDAEAIAADGSGRLHVLRAGGGGLERRDETGARVGTIPASGEAWSLRGATAIAADRFGGSYVLSRNAGAVFLFDASGRFAGRIDPPLDDRELLGDARAIAVDEAGRLYVLAGQRVRRYR